MLITNRCPAHPRPPIVESRPAPARRPPFPCGDAMNTTRPLALIDDAELLDTVLNLAAAAGCELERVPDAESARPRWNSAPLVILDGPGATQCRELALPR